MLSSLQYGIDGGIPKNDRDSEHEKDISNESSDNTTKTGDRLVADAIHAYHHSRDTYERNRSQDERFSRNLSILTTIFVLGAAASAIYSAIILTQKTSDFRDQEQRQLRAYVFPDEIAIFNADDDINKKDTELPHFEIYMKNTGVTPAYDVKTFVGGGLMTFPSNFTLRDIMFANITPTNTSASILPHDARQKSIGYIRNLPIRNCSGPTGESIARKAYGALREG